MAFQVLLWILLAWATFLPTQALLITPDDISRLLLPAYDYIIVGGGVSGLVVANRLSEDPEVTVLILEAGDLDSCSEIVTVPGLIGHGFPPAYNWNFTTTRQEFLDNRTRDYGQGHVVGGGSILNGIVMTRGTVADYNAWEALGNPGWGWKGLLPYFKKNERFEANFPQAHADTLPIRPDLTLHGTNGPLEVTYPNYLYNQSSNFLQGFSELGMPVQPDPNTGALLGAMIVPASMLAKNQSRHDARRAYLDPVLHHRPNLHLAVQQTVTRLLLRTEENSTIVAPHFGRRVAVAYGVEFTTSAEEPRRTVSCNHEVILAAGAIVSPALLQVSGIGPAPILNELNVSVHVNLPGVGFNLQDHAMVGAFYNYTKPGLFTEHSLVGPVLERAKQEYSANRTGPLTSPLITTVAFTSLHALLANDTNHHPFFNTIANLTSPTFSLQSLPPGSGRHTSLVRGYTAQLAVLRKLLARKDLPALEIMADSIGTLTVSVQRPLSRGSVRALNRDLLAGERGVAGNVALDPRYCAHEYDCALLVQALRFNRRVIATKAMQELMPRPGKPWADPATVEDAEKTYEEEGDNEQDNEALLGAVKERIQTEFHVSGTTAMMPLDMGGVVNPRLVVYGTANVRVVDAGIMPLVVGAHLQAGVYAVAEKAADLIKEDRKVWLGPPSPASIPSPSGTVFNKGNGISGPKEGRNCTFGMSSRPSHGHRHDTMHRKPAA